MVNDALAGPGALGSKVNWRLQDAPAARVEPQWLVSENEDADAPASVTLPIDSGASPLFVTVRVCGELVVPTSRDPKFTESGDICTAGVLEPLDEFPAHPQIAAVHANNSTNLHR